MQENCTISHGSEASSVEFQAFDQASEVFGNAEEPLQEEGEEAE
jgi:hypothetical protein